MCAQQLHEIRHIHKRRNQFRMSFSSTQSQSIIGIAPHTKMVEWSTKMTTLDASPPRFGAQDTQAYSFALQSPGPTRFSSAAGLGTSGRTTLPREQSAYDQPRTSRLTRSNVKLGDPLSPFTSEVMLPQGILNEKKYEVPVARARYSKRRDVAEEGRVGTNQYAHPSLYHSNSSLKLYQSTKQRLRIHEPWHDVHPQIFIRSSRQTRPSDTNSMFTMKTLEESRTPLERRRALEHEAALANVEKRRVDALNDSRINHETKQQALASGIKKDFESRRERNLKNLGVVYAWEAGDVDTHGDYVTHPVTKKFSTPLSFKRQSKSPKSKPKYQLVQTPGMGVNDALHLGARQIVGKPKVLGACKFVPDSAVDHDEKTRIATTTDELNYSNAADALSATERKLGGVTPTAKYAQYFADFARAHRETESLVTGKRINTHTVRATLLKEEQQKDELNQMAELDAFGEKVTYFHDNDLRQRLTHRGWLAPEGTLERSKSGKITLVSHHEKINPQASMVRAKAANNARVQLANTRVDLDFYESDEEDNEEEE